MHVVGKNISSFTTIHTIQVDRDVKNSIENIYMLFERAYQSEGSLLTFEIFIIR